ncbi:MAG: hypothetical protein LJE65_00660, partial [Desulfobacteraceae bacterium]|nr:hypothetical protein [Desulfobacteraceae bacterium]
MKRKDRVLHPDRNPKWNSFLAVLFLLLLSIIFFYPVLLCNRTFYAFDNLFRDLPWSPSATDAFTGNSLITDPVHQLYPFYHFIIHSFKKGFLSFWNPDYFCGFTL